VGVVFIAWFSPLDLIDEDYGGNMGLEGNLLDLTTQPLHALQNAGSMAGVGLTMEGQEGNEVFILICGSCRSSIRFF
jgi:hypothetical protein